MADDRRLTALTEQAIAVALAPGQSGKAAKIRGLMGEAFEAGAETGTATASRVYRPALAKAWGAWLDLLLQNRELLTDLKYGEPELFRRLVAALAGEGGDRA